MATSIPTLLLPGLDGSGRLFEPFVAHAPPGLDVRVVRYPAECLSLDELATIAAQSLPSHSRALVIAESFSGLVAIRMLQSEGHRVCGVVFCATFARPPRPLPSWLIVPWIARPLLRLARVSTIARALCVGWDAPTSLSDLYREAVGALPASVMVDRLKLVAALDLTEELESVQVPVLYLRGVRDRLVPARALAVFRDALPRLAVQVVDGPHLLLQAAPETCWRAVVDFLGEVRKGHDADHPRVDQGRQ